MLNFFKCARQTNDWKCKNFVGYQSRRLRCGFQGVWKSCGWKLIDSNVAEEIWVPNGGNYIKMGGGRMSPRKNFFEVLKIKKLRFLNNPVARQWQSEGCCRSKQNNSVPSILWVPFGSGYTAVPRSST